MKNGVKEALNKILLDQNHHIGNIYLGMRVKYKSMLK